MNISEAMREDSGVYPGDGTIGREREEWYAVGTLNVGSGSLQVADLGGTSSIEVSLPAGGYRVDARLIDFGGSLCLSRIRLLLNRATATGEEKRGDVSVDFGGVVICDFQQIQDQLRPAELDEFDELLPAFMTTFCDMCQLNFESGKIEFVVCKAGFGDGTYPVLVLTSGGSSIGIEVGFIANGHVLSKARRRTELSE